MLQSLCYDFLTYGFPVLGLDCNINKYIEQKGVLGVGIGQIFYAIPAELCREGGLGGIVVIVGVTFGWYTLLAAKPGAGMLTCVCSPLVSQ